MRGNTFGQLFKMHTFGESHGGALGVVLDGCPAGYQININEIQEDLNRRRPGQSVLTTNRNEKDTIKVLSGIMDGLSLGTPIAMMLQNSDAQSSDYDHLKDVYRPSHADYTWENKFGIRDIRGGGRTSARETAARVAAGSIARQILHMLGVEVLAWVEQVGHISMVQTPKLLTRAIIDSHPTRCPDLITAESMSTYITQLKQEGDSTGGIIHCRITGCQPGWGEPVFDKLNADLGKAILSINACKGFEIGSGFAGVTLRGSAHNDIFTLKDEKIQTLTNHSGGIQGGISNGMPINFRAAFKPVSTIRQNQETLNMSGERVTFEGTGRHDPCVVPRAVPIVEAMACMVLVDHYLRNTTSKQL
ncbi:MAG: chorismate synthase [Saprospiraceae bacterium]|jgi:chorismate synthase|nr:chorismate synthase [Saprospiraceae bacterium]